MRKKNLELKTTNNQIDASTQTPIEIALKIDENESNDVNKDLLEAILSVETILIDKKDDEK